jgi:hypothetical protein
LRIDGVGDRQNPAAEFNLALHVIVAQIVRHLRDLDVDANAYDAFHEAIY